MEKLVYLKIEKLTVFAKCWQSIHSSASAELCSVQIYPALWVLKSSLALHCQIHLESWVLGVHQKRCVLLPLSAQSTLLSHRLQGEQLLSLPLEKLPAVDWLQPCLQLKAFLWKWFTALLLWQRVRSSARFCLQPFIHCSMSGIWVCDLLYPLDK